MNAVKALDPGRDLDPESIVVKAAEAELHHSEFDDTQESHIAIKVKYDLEASDVDDQSTMDVDSRADTIGKLPTPPT